MTIPDKLILDYSKWRCGYNNGAVECPHQLGQGSVRLKNGLGYFCCLGMISLQLGVSEEEISDVGRPCSIGKEVPLLTRVEYGILVDTELSNDCVEINDDERTTPEEKIEKLVERFKQEGIQLEVINKP